MFVGNKIAVVVPAYNEETLIESTLRGIPDYVDTIVVIDDASTDKTSERVLNIKSSQITLIRHSHNLGVGAALRSGYQQAFTLGADIVVVMAGDGQMDPADLPTLLLPLAEGRALYVKGDRLSHPDALRRMPLLRWIGNHVLSWLTQVAVGQNVRDSQCGYTALSRAAAEYVCNLTFWPGYGYPNELIGRFVSAGIGMEHVTVRPIYGLEKSGVRLWHALFVIPYILGRVAWNRWLSRSKRLNAKIPSSTHHEDWHPNYQFPSS